MRAHLEEQVVLQAPKVLEVLVLAEAVVQMSHASRKVPLGQVVHHVGSDQLARLLWFGCVLAGDAAEEGHTEVLENGYKTIILVKARQRARCGFERARKTCRELGEDEGELFSVWHVGPSSVEKDASLVDEIRNPCPRNLYQSDQQMQ